MRKEFKIPEKDLKELMNTINEARKNPVIFLSGGARPFDSPQEAANKAWKKLGEKYGFDYLSVAPISGKSQDWISAVFKEENDK